MAMSALTFSCPFSLRPSHLWPLTLDVCISQSCNITIGDYIGLPVRQSLMTIHFVRAFLHPPLNLQRSVVAVLQLTRKLAVFLYHRRRNDPDVIYAVTGGLYAWKLCVCSLLLYTIMYVNCDYILLYSSLQIVTLVRLTLVILKAT